MIACTRTESLPFRQNQLVERSAAYVVQVLLDGHLQDEGWHASHLWTNDYLKARAVRQPIIVLQPTLWHGAV